MVDVRRGKTTATMGRSGDPGRAGAVVPHVPLQVPQQAMRQHRQPHRVRPTGGLAHVIVGHPQRRCAFCTAWRDGPTQATSPDQGASGSARGGMTAGGRRERLRSQRACAHEPAGALRQAILAARQALSRQRRPARPLGPCRDAASRPTGGRPTCRPGRHRARDVVGGAHPPLGGHVPLLEGGLVLRLGAREPAARLRRARATRRPPPTRIARVETGRAMALEAIRHHVLAWQEPLLRQRVAHGCRPLGLALTGQGLGDLARGTAGGLRVAAPPVWQDSALSHQGLARPGGLPGPHPPWPLLPLAPRATGRSRPPPPRPGPVGPSPSRRSSGRHRAPRARRPRAEGRATASAPHPSAQHCGTAASHGWCPPRPRGPWARATGGRLDVIGPP